MNREMYVGNDAEGNRMTVEIALRPVEREMMTVEHEAVTGGTELSICGNLYESRRREPFSAGQNLDQLLTITLPAAGWSLDELRELHDIWQRWHLNAMRAACAHMTLPTDTSFDARRHIECQKETGYRYGTAWLYEPLPTSVVERVQQFQRRLRP